MPEPLRYRSLSLDFEGLRTRLAQAPLEADVRVDQSEFVLALPMPDGQFADFRVVEAPIIESRLASKFPMLKTYLGQGIDDPTANKFCSALDRPNLQPDHISAAQMTNTRTPLILKNSCEVTGNSCKKFKTGKTFNDHA